MKTYTLIKIGYTAGIYGCSGEYFNIIITNGKESDPETYHTENIFFQGMYGAEQRVTSVFKDAGYKELYTQSVYGKLTRKDIPKNRFLSEYQAIDKAKELIK